MTDQFAVLIDRLFEARIYLKNGISTELANLNRHRGQLRVDQIA
ncbi:hypothetical protein [Halorubrum sp. CGM5_25_10-8B]|nr:hypothetical protein [Halorubrum sp. CGM5_25_10-8B]